MQYLQSPRWLMVSQVVSLVVIASCQWFVQERLTLVMPLMGLLITIYIHQTALFKWGRLPMMPSNASTYWAISIGWAIIMMFVYCVFQPLEEVFRVAKVLPVLAIGLSIMDWVVLVRMAELVHHVGTD